MGSKFKVGDRVANQENTLGCSKVFYGIVQKIEGNYCIVNWWSKDFDWFFIEDKVQKKELRLITRAEDILFT